MFQEYITYRYMMVTSILVLFVLILHIHQPKSGHRDFIYEKAVPPTNDIDNSPEDPTHYDTGLKKIPFKNKDNIYKQEVPPSDEANYSPEDRTYYNTDLKKIPFSNKDHIYKQEVPPTDEDDYSPKDPSHYDATGLKKILFWNDFFGDKSFYFGFGREPFIEAGCRVTTCFTTANRTRFPIEQVDALMWHFWSHDTVLPPKRSPHTRYIFYIEESPYYTHHLGEYGGFFNWSMTYRLDSDIVIPYGKVSRRLHPPPPTYRNIAEGKTKMAAWFVSNCNADSGRNVLAKRLMQYIDIDIYGDCGQYKCPKANNECYHLLERTYKFYFAFENAICRDYITEKFFNALRFNVVPVVFGYGNYSDHAPPHSYINVLDFPSVKALADYLLYLDQNDTAYNEYFRWQRFYYVKEDAVQEAYCNLCEMLHSDTSPKTYDDLNQWYLDESDCKNSTDEAISRFLELNH